MVFPPEEVLKHSSEKTEKNYQILPLESFSHFESWRCIFYLKMGFAILLFQFKNRPNEELVKFKLNAGWYSPR